MFDSYQKEIPKARVNITLDLETGGAKKKKELPFKMLVLGDFSQSKKNKTPIARREKMSIHKNNFDKVLSEINPQLKLNVANTIKNDGSDLPINLSFKKLNDFHPESIVHQVPALRKLIAMRNLLKDLRANVIDNQAFRKALEKIIGDPNKARELKKYLDKNTSWESEKEKL